MSKQHHIRWQQSDNQELARVVQNFNAKLKRLEKKNPEMKNALPDKVSVKQLKELIHTRKDLKRELNSLKRFSKRGSEEIITYGNNNIKITKWQKTELSRKIAIINRRRKARLEELEQTELTSRGKKVGYKRIEFGMGALEKNEYRPMSVLTKSMTQADVKKKWESALKQVQSNWFDKMDFQWRDNYITSLEQNYNPNDIADIIEMIKNMDIGEFTEKMRSEVGSFETSYPPDRESYGSYLTDLRATWMPKTKK